MGKLTTIIVARKPLSEPSVIENIQKWGCGALNIDGTRIATSDKLGGGGEKRSDFQGKDGWDRPWMHDPEKQEQFAAGMRERVKHAETLGRWPANLVLEHLPGCQKVGVAKVKGDRRGATGGKVECGLDGKENDIYQAGWRSSTEVKGTAYGNADGTEDVDQWECVEGCPVSDLDQSVARFFKQVQGKSDDHDTGTIEVSDVIQRQTTPTKDQRCLGVK